jgi:hypothetical protein
MIPFPFDRRRYDSNKSDATPHEDVEHACDGFLAVQASTIAHVAILAARINICEALVES